MRYKSIDQKLREKMYQYTRSDGIEVWRPLDHGLFKKNKKLPVPVEKETRQEMIARHARERKALIRRSTPKWADLKRIKEIYKQRDFMNIRARKKLGKLRGKITHYVVDHIVPIRGANVCGFHVENNLRIILYAKNAAKYNFYNED